MDEGEYFIRIGSYILSRSIGQGESSSVWLGKSTKTDASVAAKIFLKKTIETEDKFTRFQREVSLLQQINFPFIAQFYEMFEDANYYSLFMEYADNGDFGTFLESRGALNENMCRFFFSQMLLAIEYLHNECRIAHRDLKPQNILLDRYNNIRITDFGLSNTFSEINPVLNTNCGSPAYVAPEMASGQPYTKATDVWSLGVILYQMSTGYLPFQAKDVQSVLTKIVSQEPYYPGSMPSKLTALLKKMLCKSPDSRITIKEIKEDEWVIPSFVNAMSESINEIRQNKLTSVIIRDAATLQEARDEMVYELFTRMSIVRQNLPTESVHIAPSSMPLPKMDVFEGGCALIPAVTLPEKRAKLTPSPSLTELRAARNQPPLRSSRCNSGFFPQHASATPKKRTPIKVPECINV